MLNKKIIPISLLLIGITMLASAQAELPLTIENLLTTSNKWRTELSATYANSQGTNIDSSFDQIQLGSGQFVTLPVSVEQAKQNSDTLILSPGLRYGLTANTEIYARMSAIANDTRSLNTSGNTRQFTKKIASAWLGVNHRFSDENKTPALLGFFELAVGENVANTGNDWVYGKSSVLGVTTYRTIDPLVLSLTAGYLYNANRNLNDVRINPADLTFVNPSVAFAVNSDITLTSGFQWLWRQPEIVNGQKQGLHNTSTELTFGLGFSWSKQLTLLIDTRADVTSNSGIQIGLTASYNLFSRH